MPCAKRSIPKPLKEEIPKEELRYCKTCGNGGKIFNFLVWCEVKKCWNHSIEGCTKFISK